MKRSPRLSALFGSLVLLAASTVSVFAGTLDPAALSSLKRMSDQLAAAKAFTYTADLIAEVPAKNGQFLTLFPTVDVAVRRPDQLRAIFSGEAPHFDFFYNGKEAVAFAPAANVYSVKPAPPTIDAMLPALQRETGIRLAAGGLLKSDPYRAFTTGLTSAIYLGRVDVCGDACDRLALRGPGVDWEIWIEAAAPYLPKRIVASFVDQPGRPRIVVEYTRWNLRPSLHPRDFSFKAPPSSKEVPFGASLQTINKGGRP